MNFITTKHKMNRSITLRIFLFIVLSAITHANELKNADFSKGKSFWQGDGKVVSLDANDKIIETDPSLSTDEQAPVEGTPALKIDLSKNEWKCISQKFNVKDKDAEFDLNLEVKADASFSRLQNSKEYSDVDFVEGGHYWWSARVFPKCDFLIRLADDTYHYRLFSLRPLEAWKPISVKFSKLKLKQRVLELLLPPGEGYVLIRIKKSDS